MFDAEGSELRDSQSDRARSGPASTSTNDRWVSLLSRERSDHVQSPASSLNTDHGLPAFLTRKNLSMELPITAYGNNASWAVLVFVLCNFAIDV